jgi:hypothetical protein
VQGSPAHYWARCANYDELRLRPCPGWIEYHPGDLDAACDTCRGRCGWQVSGPGWLDRDTLPGWFSEPPREWFVG